MREIEKKKRKKNHVLLSHGPRKLAYSAMEVSKQLYLGGRVGGSPKKQWEVRVLGKICLGFWPVFEKEAKKKKGKFC